MRARSSRSSDFFHYELPKAEGLVQRLLEADGLTVQMNDPLFSD